MRDAFGAVVVIGAFALLAYVVYTVLPHFTQASQDVAVIGSVAGVVGTLVAAYFGVRAAGAQTRAAHQTAQESQ